MENYSKSHSFAKEKDTKINLVLAIIIMAGILLFLLPLISGEVQTLGTFQKDKCIILSQTCDNCTSVNITSLIYPNSTIDLQGANMTKHGTYYNYTFCKTSALGHYIYNTLGDANGIGTVQPVDFEINSGGANLTTAQGILYVLFLVAGIFAFLITLFGAIKVPFKNKKNDDGRIISMNNLKYFKVILMALCYMELLFIFGITKSITENFLVLNGANNMFNWLYWLMFALLYPIMVCSVIFMVIVFVQDINDKKLWQRGLLPR